MSLDLRRLVKCLICRLRLCLIEAFFSLMLINILKKWTGAVDGMRSIMLGSNLIGMGSNLFVVFVRSFDLCLLITTYIIS